MTTQNTGSIGYEIIAMKRACETTPYLRPDCEYDGWPLETTPDGLRHCRFGMARSGPHRQASMPEACNSPPRFWPLTGK